jgi:DNA-binding beta-propeller fold protein YncE
MTRQAVSTPRTQDARRTRGPRRFTSSLLALLLLLCACAPSASERKRYFWPPPIFDQPRIEYIDQYRTDADARRGAESWLEEAILGKERPRRVFSRPKDIASDGSGRVFVTDVDLRKVVVFDLARHKLRFLRTADGAEATFRFPAGIAVDGDGRVYVTDSATREVVVFGADETRVASFGAGQLSRPTGLAVDAERGRLYVVDTDAHAVAVFDAAGNYLSTIGRPGGGEGEFNFPLDAAVDPEGNLYVLDSMNARVQVFDPAGGWLRAFGERGTAPGAFQVAKALAVSPSGHVYVTDSRAHRFYIYDQQGSFLLAVGGMAAMTGEGVSPGGLYLPQGIDVDANEAIWVVDSLNRMFHRFQYLSEKYLAEHPILPGQAYLPPELEGLPAGGGK